MISTDCNRYRMSAMGAPISIRLLAPKVIFTDRAEDKHIAGRKADLTHHEISRHVRMRRLAARPGLEMACSGGRQASASRACISSRNEFAANTALSRGGRSKGF